MDGDGRVDGVVDRVEDGGIRVYLVVRYREPLDVLTF